MRKRGSLSSESGVIFLEDGCNGAFHGFVAAESATAKLLFLACTWKRSLGLSPRFLTPIHQALAVFPPLLLCGM